MFLFLSSNYYLKNRIPNNCITQIEGYIRKKFGELYEKGSDLVNFWENNLKTPNNIRLGPIIIKNITNNLILENIDSILFSAIDVKDFNKYYFDEYFEQNNGLTHKHFDLTFNCIDINNSHYLRFGHFEYKYELDKIDKLKERINEYPSKFLDLLVYGHYPPSTSKINQCYIKNIFGTIKEFEVFLEGLDDKKNLKPYK